MKLTYHRRPNPVPKNPPAPPAAVVTSASGRHMLAFHSKPKGFKRLKAELYELRLDLPDSAQVLNPSVVSFGGKLRVIIRSLQGNATVNHMGVIDERWRLTHVHRVNDLSGKARYPRAFTRGLEDVRLHVVNGALHGVATVCDMVEGDDHPKIALLEFDAEENVRTVKLQLGPRHEKNWMPVDDLSGRYVYSVDPLIVVAIDPATGKLKPKLETIESTGHLRGGSQVVPYQGGYLAVVHEVYGGCPQTYLHRFVRFDEKLSMVVARSEPFYFSDLGIEFCAGLAFWAGSCVLSYGGNDRHAMLAVLPTQEIDRLV